MLMYLIMGTWILNFWMHLIDGVLWVNITANKFDWSITLFAHLGEFSYRYLVFQINEKKDLGIFSLCGKEKNLSAKMRI